MVRFTVSRWFIPALLAVALPGAASAAGPATSRKAQLQFGVDMARRGLWSEALFRFEKANSLEPNDAGVLNNLAVCYEAAGRFEDALKTYRDALAIDPGNRALKQNYSRFADFYQDFRVNLTKPAPADPSANLAPTPGTAPADPPGQSPAPPQDPPAGGGR